MQNNTPADEDLPSGAEGDDIEWLKQRAMLLQNDSLMHALGGNREQWQHPFGKSNCTNILANSSVWLSVYADSLMGMPGQNVLDVLGTSDLQKLLSEIGIKAIHTGPLKRSGSIKNREYGRSIDGHFDRIESRLDPAYGDQQHYRKMVDNGNEFGITIIGDLVPGHTGKGADFRLAEKAVPGFANLYSMLEIATEDWAALPDVPVGQDSINLSQSTVRKLKRLNYAVIAPMNAEVFARPNIKESCWSATDVIKGVDGVARRWVYLHVFKQGQPSLNWMDPSFAAYRMQTADILHSLKILGTKGLRMDATMFLGVEARPAEDKSCLAGHPLSSRVTDLLAMMIRKSGGFSFQELNVELDILRNSLTSGPEFNYDFASRPAYLYALVTSDAGPLRLVLREMVKYQVQPNRMVHGMQNHDELMLEATHFKIHGDEVFEYEGVRISGDDLFTKLSETVLNRTTGENGEYNHGFAMSPGVCSTFVGLISASLGIKNLDEISAPQRKQIKQIHLLAAAFNALQGGIFNISAWDLVGALPLSIESVGSLLADNDHRWINRGAYDLLGMAGDQNVSMQGLPKSATLYPAISEQLKDPDSFVSLLKTMLELRESLGIAQSELISVPEVGRQSLLIMVNRLPAGGENEPQLQITALNFAETPAVQSIKFPGEQKEVTTRWSSVEAEAEQHILINHGRLTVELLPYEAQLIVSN